MRRQRSAELSQLAERFPRVCVWRCAALLTDLPTYPATTISQRTHALVDELLAHQERDGHWLVGCCLVAEATAQLGDVELAKSLEAAFRPFADTLAVAGRVGAFRGSVSYPMGLLALTLGDPDVAVSDLERAVARHDRMGARPFNARSLTALVRALEARAGAEDDARATAARRTAADLVERLGTGGYGL